MLVHIPTCNPSTQEVEAGGPSIHGQPRLHGPCLKNKCMKNTTKNM
jgi:hypothetical protein